MITFREFLNKKDDRPITGEIMPSKMMSGLQVAKDLTQVAAPSFVKAPTFKPVSLLSGRKPSDQPIAKKPSDFLARKGSSFRKGF